MPEQQHGKSLPVTGRKCNHHVMPVVCIQGTLQNVHLRMLCHCDWKFENITWKSRSTGNEGNCLLKVAKYALIACSSIILVSESISSESIAFFASLTLYTPSAAEEQGFPNNCFSYLVWNAISYLYNVTSKTFYNLLLMIYTVNTRAPNTCTLLKKHCILRFCFNINIILSQCSFSSWKLSDWRHILVHFSSCLGKGIFCPAE